MQGILLKLTVKLNETDGFLAVQAQNRNLMIQILKPIKGLHENKCPVANFSPSVKAKKRFKELKYANRNFAIIINKCRLNQYSPD